MNYRDMTIGITTAFPLEPFELAVLRNSEVTPLPSGVLMNINQVVAPYFGFAEDAYPFNEGMFFTAGVNHPVEFFGVFYEKNRLARS
ncbi:hypothetical protein [Candidatus Arsenophonus triatominarum]|uniref:hypothetical protein n=1 Tax=Candidatus Arsenophonus triatominarum TaxID=57911 RepID=UPI0007C4D32C|nr:hypothetical protein [Candidatus Arsenophonus triatominarum]